MQRKRPLHGKIFARCIPKRLFAGLFGCMARISCQNKLILDTRRRYAATNWRFSRLRPLSGYMERKTCHGLPPGDAFREHFAIVERTGTHRASILPLPVRPRAHQGAIPPPSDAGGTHFTGILPSVSARNATAPCASTSCVAAPSMLAPNAPPMPYVPVAHAPAPPATAPRCHAPCAALLSPLKK